MDLQTTFYTLGVIVFSLFLVLLLVIGFFALNIYFRYKAMVVKTKRRVERMKEAMPVVSYFFSMLNERRNKGRS